MNFQYYLDKGGTIMYILLVLNIIGFTIMIYKFIEFLLLKRKEEKIIKNLLNINETNSENAYILNKDLLTKQIITYESGLSTVKIIASIAPLLGLLGTVLGVLSSFDAISKNGLGNPHIFANGISLALITTVGGLVVAIPHYVGYNYLVTMLDKIEANLNAKLTSKLYGKKS